MEESEKEKLTAEIRNLSAIITKLYNRQSPWMAFVSGIMYGIGYFVGFVIIISIIIYLLQRVPLIPIIGDWLGEIMNQALKNVKTPSAFPFFN